MNLKQVSRYTQVKELVERINIFTKPAGILVEAYDDTPGVIARVQTRPDPNASELARSSIEVFMDFNGTDPNGEPLVEIVLDDMDGDVIYMSPHARAIASILLA